MDAIPTTEIVRQSADERLTVPAIIADAGDGRITLHEIERIST
jgi:hypothetical protein